MAQSPPPSLDAAKALLAQLLAQGGSEPSKSMVALVKGSIALLVLALVLHVATFAVRIWQNYKGQQPFYLVKLVPRATGRFIYCHPINMWLILGAIGLLLQLVFTIRTAVAYKNHKILPGSSIPFLDFPWAIFVCALWFACNGFLLRMHSMVDAFESLEKSQPLLRAWAIPGRLYNTILLALPIGLLLLTSFLTALLTANVSRGLYNIAKSIDLLQGILAGTSPLDTYGSAVAITQNALSHIHRANNINNILTFSLLGVIVFITLVYTVDGLLVWRRLSVLKNKSLDPKNPSVAKTRQQKESQQSQKGGRQEMLESNERSLWFLMLWSFLFACFYIGMFVVVHLKGEASQETRAKIYNLADKYGTVLFDIPFVGLMLYTSFQDAPQAARTGSANVHRPVPTDARHPLELSFPPGTYLAEKSKVWGVTDMAPRYEDQRMLPVLRQAHPKIAAGSSDATVQVEGGENKASRSDELA